MFGKKAKETTKCCQAECKPSSDGCGCGSKTQTNKPAKEKQGQNCCC